MRRWFFTFAFLLAFSAAGKAQEFFFKDGDRVVMIGDSITEQHLYSNYVEMWTVTRFPAWNITFRNTGIGGDTSRGGNGRFKRDVLAYKPTAMTVDFGMNDGGYRAFDEPGFKNYMGGLQGMADQAKAGNVRAAWVTPQPLDDAKPGKTALVDYNLTLEKYSEGVKQIAEKNGGLFVDQFHPYLAVLDKARAAAPEYKRITAGDAVHPGEPGQALMAASILKGLRFPDAVSSVEIEVTPDKWNAKFLNCEVKVDGKPNATDTYVKFERRDEALPFFPEKAKSILAWSPIQDELNKYMLKITGLKEGKYDVKLGGEKVATYTSAELAKGVNLAGPALAAGPVAAQVKAVVAAVEAKNKYHHDRIFRGIVLSQAQIPDWLGLKMSPQDIDAKRKAAVEERMAKMPELDAAVKKALEIKPHTVEVTLAK